MDEYDETIYGKVSGRPDLVEQWKDGCRVRAYERKAWVKKMRALGVRASHPDDGWVDRENNHLQLCYPDFERSLAVGSLIDWGIRRIIDWSESRRWTLSSVSYRTRLSHTNMSLMSLSRLMRLL